MHVRLAEWVKQKPVQDGMLYKDAAGSQIETFCDFAKKLGGYEPYVVGSHRSKSIELPVVMISTAFGRIYARDNFHDIKVSVEVEAPLNHDLFGLLAGNDSYLSSVYFEGFESQWIHRPFVLGASRFSASMDRRSLPSLARTLYCYYSGRDLLLLQDALVQEEIARRKAAELEEFPVLSDFADLVRLVRFFKPSKDIEPCEERLRDVFVRPGREEYTGKPPSFLRLDFSGGCPEPMESWFRVLDRLIQELRSDPKVQEVHVFRLTPFQQKLAAELGCEALTGKSP